MVVALTLTDLPVWLATRTIEETYSDLGFDYASVGRRDHTDFLSRFQWRVPPSEEVLRRLFNQINSSYAERTARSRPGLGLDQLLEVNSLFLCREGKPLGLRSKEIAFGARKHLDRFHPMRAVKWLAGPDPSGVRSLVVAWSDVAMGRDFDVERALLMTMLLIALHPFADANGRMARLAFTTLLQQSDSNLLWLNEASDGELLRTGSGVNSTEYLMAIFTIGLADGANVIMEDGRAKTEKVADALAQRIAALRRGDWSLLKTDAFRQLHTHLLEDGHLVSRSPRFECLRDSIVS